MFIFSPGYIFFGLFSVFILCTTCCCIMYHTILHMLHKIACFALHVVFICVILQLNHQVLSCFFLIYFIWLDITCHTMVLNIIHSIVCFWIDMTSQQWLIGYDILAISYHIMSYPSVSCYHACIWYCIRWCHLISSILSHKVELSSSTCLFQCKSMMWVERLFAGLGWPPCLWTFGLQRLPLFCFKHSHSPFPEQPPIGKFSNCPSFGILPVTNFLSKIPLCPRPKTPWLQSHRMLLWFAETAAWFSICKQFLIHCSGSSETNTRGFRAGFSIYWPCNSNQYFLWTCANWACSIQCRWVSDALI